MKLIFLAIIFALSVSPSLAQNTQRTKSKKSSTSNSRSGIKVDKKKPSIYIAFEKFGKRTPLRDDESDEGIYLRFHNNLRYSIRFCAFGISEDAERLIAYSKDTQMGISYDVELNSVSRTQRQLEIDVPSGYPVGGICHYYELEAGQSMIFSAPKEHLIKGVSIKIGFSYEWEEESEERPTHFIYFNSLDVPK